MTSHIMPTYGRLPVTFEKGEGVWLWDQSNKRYLDALSGIAVCNLGHAHPAISQAISQQSKTLLHTSNLYGIATQENLADELIKKSAMDNVFFCNSGAEANEAAIKIARLYGHQQGFEKPCILAMEKSFHGRTMGTLSATGNSKIQDGFSPLVEGFVHVPFNNIAAINKAIAENNIVAIMVEPVQGEGGVNIPDADYLNQIRDICDQHQSLLIMDEVKTGFRVAKGGAQELYGIKADLTTYAKAMGNGYPVAAFGGRADVMDVISFNAKGVTHGGTYTANMIALSAAKATLTILNETDAYETINKVGAEIQQVLSRVFTKHGIEHRFAGPGSMFGIHFGDLVPTNYRDWKQTDSDLYTEFAMNLIKHGIMLEPDSREPWFICESHKDVDLVWLEEIADRSMAEAIAAK